MWVAEELVEGGGLAELEGVLVHEALGGDEAELGAGLGGLGGLVGRGEAEAGELLAPAQTHVVALVEGVEDEADGGGGLEAPGGDLALGELEGAAEDVEGADEDDELLPAPLGVRGRGGRLLLPLALRQHLEQRTSPSLHTPICRTNHGEWVGTGGGEAGEAVDELEDELELPERLPVLLVQQRLRLQRRRRLHPTHAPRLRPFKTPFISFELSRRKKVLRLDSVCSFSALARGARRSLPLGLGPKRGWGGLGVRLTGVELGWAKGWRLAAAAASGLWAAAKKASAVVPEAARASWKDSMIWLLVEASRSWSGWRPAAKGM